MLVNDVEIECFINDMNEQVNNAVYIRNKYLFI